MATSNPGLSVAVTSISAGAITAAAIATNAIDADALAADAVAELADGVWDEAKSGHTTVGTYGGDTMQRAVKTATFAGTAGTGAVGSFALFTTTGSVQIVSIQPTCTTLLESAGGGTLALGVTGNTAVFVAATTATDIDAGEIWVDTAPDANGVALPAAMKDILIADNDEILATIAVGDITAGVIEFVVWYLPMSSGASLVAA